MISPVADRILRRLRQLHVDHSANDNISMWINDGELQELEREVEQAVLDLLRTLCIDVDHDHNTMHTPARVARMLLHETMAGRYHGVPEITSFPNAKKLDELYVTGPITVRSLCSHHLQPIHGQCWIGVIPGERVIGLSKFNRLADWVFSRPQIQEEAVVQLADTIEKAIEPQGLAVVIKAAHHCMIMRGVREPANATMKTSVMRGTLMNDEAARAEFLRLIEL